MLDANVILSAAATLLLTATAANAMVAGPGLAADGNTTTTSSSSSSSSKSSNSKLNKPGSNYLDCSMKSDNKYDTVYPDMLNITSGLIRSGTMAGWYPRYAVEGSTLNANLTAAVALLDAKSSSVWSKKLKALLLTDYYSANIIADVVPTAESVVTISFGNGDSAQTISSETTESSAVTTGVLASVTYTNNGYLYFAEHCDKDNKTNLTTLGQDVAKVDQTLINLLNTTTNPIGSVNYVYIDSLNDDAFFASADAFYPMRIVGAADYVSGYPTGVNISEPCTAFYVGYKSVASYSLTPVNGSVPAETVAKINNSSIVVSALGTDVHEFGSGVTVGTVKLAPIVTATYSSLHNLSSIYQNIMTAGFITNQEKVANEWVKDLNETLVKNLADYTKEQKSATKKKVVFVSKGPLVTEAGTVVKRYIVPSTYFSEIASYSYLDPVSESAVTTSCSGFTVVLPNATAPHSERQYIGTVFFNHENVTADNVTSLKDPTQSIGACLSKLDVDIVVDLNDSSNYTEFKANYFLENNVSGDDGTKKYFKECGIFSTAKSLYAGNFSMFGQVGIYQPQVIASDLYNGAYENGELPNCNGTTTNNTTVKNYEKWNKKRVYLRSIADKVNDNATTFTAYKSSDTNKKCKATTTNDSYSSVMHFTASMVAVVGAAVSMLMF